MQFVKRIENLLKIAGIKFVLKLGNPFSQKVSFLVIKAIKCKRGMFIISRI